MTLVGDRAEVRIDLRLGGADTVVDDVFTMAGDRIARLAIRPAAG